MGWERKRGKLDRSSTTSPARRRSTDAAARPAGAGGAAEEDFDLQLGDAAFCAGVHFVIVLDADTELPRGAARRLVGDPRASAQPRRARCGEPARVVAGYTILQPRVEISPLSADALALRGALFAGDAATRPVHARGLRRLPGPLRRRHFRRQGDLRRRRRSTAACAARVPDNALLSHDLFEGVHGRAGAGRPTSSSIEDYPDRAISPTPGAWHRWVRGDWQLLPWLGRTVPSADGGRGRIGSRSSPAGRSSTTCAAAWSRPPLVLWLAARLAAAAAGRRCCGRRSAPCWCPRVPWLVDLLARAQGPILRRALGPAIVPAGAVAAHRRSARWALRDRLPAAQAAVVVDAIARTLVRLSSRAASCCSGRPRRTPPAAWPATRAARLARDGRRAAAGDRRGGGAAALATARAAAAAPLLLLWMRCAGARRATSAGRCRARRRELAPADDRAACACWRAAPGRSSRPSSARTTSGCRRITSRRIRAARWRAARRRPTSACCSSRRWPRYDFGYRGLLWHGAPAQERLRHTRPPGALSRPLSQLVRHRHARAAGAALRLDGRQRQSRDRPGHREAGVPRASGRRRRPGPAVGRISRHARRPARGDRIGPGAEPRRPAAPSSSEMERCVEDARDTPGQWRGAVAAPARRAASPPSNGRSSPCRSRMRRATTPPSSASCTPGRSASKSISNACSARWICSSRGSTPSPLPTTPADRAVHDGGRRAVAAGAAGVGEKIENRNSQVSPPPPHPGGDGAPPSIGKDGNGVLESIGDDGNGVLAGWDELANIAATIPTVAELPQVIDRARQALAEVREQLTPDAQDWAERFGTALRRRPPGGRVSARPPRGGRRTRRGLRRRDGLRVALRHAPAVFSTSATTSAPSASTSTTTTSSPPRRAWQLSRHRQGRRAGGALAPSRPADRAGGQGARALLSWSGTMFEYLMPRAAAARRRRDPDRAQLSRGRDGSRSPTRGAAAFRGASRSRGYVAVRRAAELSVPRLRRAVARLQARPRRGPGRRAVRFAAGPPARAAAVAENLVRLIELGGDGPLRTLRGDRLHAWSRRQPGEPLRRACARSWRTTRA